MKSKTKSNLFSATNRFLSFSLISLLLLLTIQPAIGQSRVSGVRKSGGSAAEREKEKRELKNRRESLKSAKNAKRDDDDIKPVQIITDAPVARTTAEITAEQSRRQGEKTAREILLEKGLYPEFEGPEREDLPQNPNAPAISEYPVLPAKKKRELQQQRALGLLAPQPIGLNFDTVTGPTETGAFPPDTMGTVGPSQIVVFLNGRLRSFNKTTGAADGVLNFDTDVFYASILTPPGAGEVSFTTDPNVRYDRLTGRWFLTMIDATLNTTTGATTRVNRILIAVSDAASSAALTAGTVWNFYQFTGDATLFTDYTSLGIDANALYIGGNMFTLAGAFNSTKGFVIPKAPFLTGSLGTIYAFPNLAAGTGAGPFSPRGVDDVNPANTGPTATGYFVGVDNAVFSSLTLRRVTNPGAVSGTPTISANISLVVPTTTSSNPVTHLGNTGGNNGRLDALDDRLYAAVLRNGRLWTAHNFRVNSSGVANTGTEARNAVRWYEIQNLGTTPGLFQSGTVFDNAATLAAAQQYWIPSITVNGQGHVALGASTAGTNFRINAITTGRLAGDTLGTMRNGPGQIAPYTNNTTFAYNPPADPGPPRRWGDYSFTAVDPLDDMTIWTFQQYNNSINTYGIRVAQLLAPPPASIANGPNAGLYDVQSGQTSVNVTITGTSVSGSGFYDPGPDLGGGARPFRHITASVSGTNVTVNGVTYNSPTSITLNLNTVGASLSDRTAPETVRNLTITNPDGQSVTRSAILNIVTVTAASVTLSGKITDADGRGLAGVRVSLTNAANETVSATTNSFGFYQFDGVQAGQTYVLSAASRRFQFSEPTRVINVTESLENQNFTALPQ